MKPSVLFLNLLFLSLSLTAQDYYYPKSGAQWAQRSPESFGLSSEKINAVVSFAQAN